MSEPICTPLDDAKTISDEQTLCTWLKQQATAYKLKYLLAHAEDGVIWGQFKEKGKDIELVTADSVFPQFAKLRSHTLQQCRAFGNNAEIMLWKVEKTWKARLVEDKNGVEPIKEYQILWGTHGKKHQAEGFTLLWDGQQGLKHAVPFTDITFENHHKLKHPVRLLVHHYINYDDAGVARIYLSRLVSLTAKEIKS